MIKASDPAASHVQAKVVASAASDVFVRNLVLILAFGVAASAWLLYYTDWFTEVSVLFALSGVFTWLGVVSKLLPEERLKELQGRLDEAVFQRSGWRIYLGGAVVALLALASCVGTIDVKSTGESTERLVWFDYNPADLGDAVRLSPSGNVREPRFTTFWKPTQVRVKVGGYPSALVDVTPWRRTSIDVPATLLLANPVVLLRPTKRLALHVTGLKLVVTSGGQTRELPFDGHAVWIGCDADVHVPPRRLDEWRTGAESGTLLAKWQYPRAIDLPLAQGTVLQVALLNEDGSEFVKLPPIHPRRAARPDDFPQVEDVDVPE